MPKPPLLQTLVPWDPRHVPLPSEPVLEVRWPAVCHPYPATRSHRPWDSVCHQFLTQLLRRGILASVSDPRREYVLPIINHSVSSKWCLNSIYSWSLKYSCSLYKTDVNFQTKQQIFTKRKEAEAAEESTASSSASEKSESERWFSDS